MCDAGGARECRGHPSGTETWAHGGRARGGSSPSPPTEARAGAGRRRSRGDWNGEFRRRTADALVPPPTPPTPWSSPHNHHSSYPLTSTFCQTASPTLLPIFGGAGREAARRGTVGDDEGDSLHAVCPPPLPT
ncbi:hypothetical protein HNY73_022377 [Argiope bruennichi]|uniref:Uncharacterized protein n=1 Tax=Argiope bruennichi TaxID=94029 RepID=A0A8T0E0H5_ARGBR|nr:hypothetical protein HNY73_022377 [Argiope bruennichi]